MPKEARVFVAEDSSEWQQMIKKQLTNAGHHVVGTAKTIDEALTAVLTFESLQIQVATLDGNLKPNEMSGNDGQLLLAAIKQYAPSVKTIGLSGSKIQGVDQDLGKTNIENLGKTVTKL